jgi:hypothetical protein
LGLADRRSTWPLSSSLWDREAAVRGDVELDLVSVDSTVSRAHHHAAGMVVAPELLEELEKAVAAERGLHQRGKPDSPAAP